MDSGVARTARSRLKAIASVAEVSGAATIFRALRASYGIPQSNFNQRLS